MAKRHKFYTIKKFDGDDLYSWAVFRKKDVVGKGSIIFWGQAVPVMSGLSKNAASYEADKLEKRQEENAVSD